MSALASLLPLAVAMDAFRDRGAGSSTPLPLSAFTALPVIVGWLPISVASERCDIRACGQGLALRVDGQGADPPRSRSMAGCRAAASGPSLSSTTFAPLVSIGKVDGLDFLAPSGCFSVRMEPSHFQPSCRNGRSPRRCPRGSAGRFPANWGEPVSA